MTGAVARGRTVRSDPSWRCRRCGTDNHRMVPEDGPWCSDCMGIIAIDPGYLAGHPDAQALLDRYVNRRHGARRRVHATTA